jgi:hypothetical protein
MLEQRGTTYILIVTDEERDQSALQEGGRNVAVKGFASVRLQLEYY